MHRAGAYSSLTLISGTRAVVCYVLRAIPVSALKNTDL